MWVKEQVEGVIRTRVLPKRRGLLQVPLLIVPPILLAISKTLLRERVRYLSLHLAMSTPPNNERSPRNWFKQNFRSIFSSSKSLSRNLDVPDTRPTSTNINNSPLAAQTRENYSPFQVDGPPVKADCTGSGESIDFNS